MTTVATEMVATGMERVRVLLARGRRHLSVASLRTAPSFLKLFSKDAGILLVAGSISFRRAKGRAGQSHCRVELLLEARKDPVGYVYRIVQGTVVQSVSGYSLSTLPPVALVFAPLHRGLA